MANGYMGKILTVNLTTGKIEVEPLQDDLCRDYIGGYGMAARLLYDRIPPGADPLGPNTNSMLYNAVDESSRADGSRWGGIQGYWMAEGGTITASSSDFRQVELSLCPPFMVRWFVMNKRTDELCRIYKKKNEGKCWNNKKMGKLYKKSRHNPEVGIMLPGMEEMGMGYVQG